MVGRGVQPPHLEHPAPKLHRLNSLEWTSACRLPCCQLSPRIPFPVCSLCCSPCSRARRLQAVLDTAAKVTFQMQVCLCTSSAQRLCWVRAHSGEQPASPQGLARPTGPGPAVAPPARLCWPLCSCPSGQAALPSDPALAGPPAWTTFPSGLPGPSLTAFRSSGSSDPTRPLPCALQHADKRLINTLLSLAPEKAGSMRRGVCLVHLRISETRAGPGTQFRPHICLQAERMIQPCLAGVSGDGRRHPFFLPHIHVDLCLGACVSLEYSRVLPFISCAD